MKEIRTYIGCPTCFANEVHIVGTMEVKCGEMYRATKLIINGIHTIEAETVYEFRTQGNLHILFTCESGHFFIQSYDGHKGNMFFNDNSLMDRLADYLNTVYKGRNELTYGVNYELLGHIEKFLDDEHVAKKGLL